MKAAIYENYGPADAVKVAQVQRPEIDDTQVLVKVYSSSVTTADWRIRASAFPGGMWLLGRLMVGLFAPRNKVLGHEFAGRIVSVGANITNFKMGDAVFGFADGGAHAEYLAIGEDGPIAQKPKSMDYDEAVTLPFGAVCALVFLRDFAKLQPGQNVLVTGASGGVGVYGVQIAKALGANVTAVASAKNIALVESLGADEVIDYTKQDFTKAKGAYDVIFDTAGVSAFTKSYGALKPNGRFLPLEFGLIDLFPTLIAKVFGSKRQLLRVSSDNQQLIEEVRELADNAGLRAVIDSRYALENIVDAYHRVETRHKTGSVVISVGNPEKS